MKRKRVNAPRAKKYTKKYKTPDTVTNVSRSSLQRRPLGNVTSAALIYWDRGDVNPGVGGVVNTQVYSLSSLFDPDVTGGGHQPMGHDQLAALFERYQVWKVDFKVVFTNDDTSNPIMVGYRVNDTSTGVSSAQETIENGNCEWSVLSPKGGMDRCVFKGSIHIPQVHGVSYKQYMSNDDYGANFGSNPVEQAYLHLFADGLGTDTSTASFTIQMQMHSKIMGSLLTGTS